MVVPKSSYDSLRSEVIRVLSRLVPLPRENRIYRRLQAITSDNQAAAGMACLLATAGVHMHRELLAPPRAAARLHSREPLGNRQRLQLGGGWQVNRRRRRAGQARQFLGAALLYKLRLRQRQRG